MEMVKKAAIHSKYYVVKNYLLKNASMESAYIVVLMKKAQYCR